MSFKIKAVSLANFRSYVSKQFLFSPDVNIVVGDNAIGKTNLVEALQLLTMLDSFRTSRWEDVVAWGCSEGSISMDAEDGKRKMDIQAIFKDNRRIYRLNGKQKTISELRGILPSVLFTPDDLRLVKDSASRRRFALDMVGIQLSGTYASIKSDYEKVVTQRNQLLKDPFTPAMLLDSWTESLVTIGALFYTHRMNLFTQLRSRFLDIYCSLIPGEEINIEYVPCWIGEEGLPAESDIEGILRFLANSMAVRERAAQTTLFGPQRDSIDFFIGGRNARQFASQGQQRTLALAWKLAEVETIAQIKGTAPVLLLDDVMSELDSYRRSMLLGYIGGKRIQTFITTTGLDYFSQATLDNAHVISLPEGD